MTLQDRLNAANPTNLPDAARLLKLGDMLQGNLIQHVRGLNMDALGVAPEDAAAAVDSFVPPMPAARILRGIPRAGGVTVAEMVAAAPEYGDTPSTGEFAISPAGNIVTLGTDAWTDVDFIYVPERGRVVQIDLSVVPATGVCTLPASITAQKVCILMKAEVLAGSVTGRKRILVPASSAPATLQARLSLPKTVVHFNAATDAPTRARLTLLLGETTFDLQDVLASEPAVL